MSRWCATRCIRFSYGASDAGKLLGIDRACVMELIADREITAVEITREIRVVVSSLLDYVARLAAASPKRTEPQPVSASLFAEKTTVK